MNNTSFDSTDNNSSDNNTTDIEEELEMLLDSETAIDMDTTKFIVPSTPLTARYSLVTKRTQQTRQRKRKLCVFKNDSVAECDQLARDAKSSLCTAHGGGTYCLITGCRRFAMYNTDESMFEMYCTGHADYHH